MGKWVVYVFNYIIVELEYIKYPFRILLKPFCNLGKMFPNVLFLGINYYLSVNDIMRNKSSFMERNKMSPMTK